jgi:replication factor C small subunit
MNEIDWAQKYRPTNIDEVILPLDTKGKLINIVKNKGGMSLLFWGRPGCGKTTVARMINPATTMNFPCISGRPMVAIKKLEETGNTFTLSGERRIVILDEAENLSKEVQIALRSLIEDLSVTTDFVMTANDPNGIAEALRSRCFPVHFNLNDNQECLVQTRSRLIEIARIEGKINCENSVDKALSDSYPDIRRVLKQLQFSLT